MREAPQFGKIRNLRTKEKRERGTVALGQ